MGSMYRLLRRFPWKHPRGVSYTRHKPLHGDIHQEALTSTLEYMQITPAFEFSPGASDDSCPNTTLSRSEYTEYTRKVADTI